MAPSTGWRGKGPRCVRSCSSSDDGHARCGGVHAESPPPTRSDGPRPSRDPAPGYRFGAARRARSHRLGALRARGSGRHARRIAGVLRLKPRTIDVARNARRGDRRYRFGHEGPRGPRGERGGGERAVRGDDGAAPKGWDPATPLPRSRTTIVIADPSGRQAPRTYDLRGNYEPEAFSTDDRNLFLIQHLPAETPTVYRVTVLDLKFGFVRPVFGPYKSPPERMPGTRLQQVYAPDGGKLYTLYTSTRAGYAPHDAPVPSDAAVSFVHVLSLSEGWAHCVGLPPAMWDQPASAQALATSADGRSLYIVDSARGLVTVMDTRSLEIFGTHQIDLHRAGAPPHERRAQRGRQDAVRGCGRCDLDARRHRHDDVRGHGSVVRGRRRLWSRPVR